MQQNRDYAISQTLKYEGGYSNNPHDSGGPTNWGITLVDARKYWKHDATADDVKNMPKSIAINIYENKYWCTPQYSCDDLASGVDLAVFDFGVNSGPSRAYSYLMQSIGGSDIETINRLCDFRLAFLQQLKTWSTFGKGWTSRVEGIRQTALKMVSIATEKPTDASNDDQGTDTTSDLGNRVDQAKSWWDRFKDWDINWKAFFRQFSIAGSAVIGFATDHKVIALAAVTGIALFALWVALGRPHFWKPWRLFK